MSAVDFRLGSSIFFVFARPHAGVQEVARPRAGVQEVQHLYSFLLN